jgi:hypothetical protein
MKKKLIPVKDHSGFAVDPSNGAVININRNEIEQAREIKKSRLKDKERIDQLETDIQDIKSMLQELIRKND